MQRLRKAMLKELSESWYTNEVHRVQGQAFCGKALTSDMWRGCVSAWRRFWGQTQRAVRAQEAEDA